LPTFQYAEVHAVAEGPVKQNCSCPPLEHFSPALLQVGGVEPPLDELLQPMVEPPTAAATAKRPPKAIPKSAPFIEIFLFFSA